MHIRHLLDELKLKKKFVPDIIYIDYLNICTSSRIQSGNGLSNTYVLVKSIAEELRGLSVEHGAPIVTATQTNREGYDSSDPGLTDTSESFGLPATADLMFVLIQTEALEKQNLYMVKQLKNRYNDPAFHRKFVLGVDKPKMKIYDADNSMGSGFVGAAPSSSPTTTPSIQPEKTKFSKFKFGD
jgi:hypothetical protein